MNWNQFGDSIELDPDPHLSNFVDPYTIDADPHHCFSGYNFPAVIYLFMSVGKITIILDILSSEKNVDQNQRLKNFSEHSTILTHFLLPL